ncbi:unnamed protein product, partial [Ectocarpus fasciculatus]
RVLSEHLKLEADAAQRKEDACKKWAVRITKRTQLVFHLGEVAGPTCLSKPVFVLWPGHPFFLNTAYQHFAVFFCVSAKPYNLRDVVGFRFRTLCEGRRTQE